MVLCHFEQYWKGEVVLEALNGGKRSKENALQILKGEDAELTADQKDWWDKFLLLLSKVEECGVIVRNHVI